MKAGQRGDQANHQWILGLVEWEAHNYAEFVNALINETIKANA